MRQVGVCGAGAMGSGIAQIAAQAGHRVVLYDVAESARGRSQAQIEGGVAQLLKRGKLDEAQAGAALAAIEWTGDIRALADCDLVIEAIIEDLSIKQAFFAELEAIIAPDAILATNTSSLPIARLANGLKHPARFIGMHFFNPATVMKLVEVVTGPATDPAVAERTAQTARSWGKVTVPVADVPGFIVNRVARPFYAEAFRSLQQQGAAPEVIDYLFRAGAGFRMGPLELTDLIGQEVNFAVAGSVYSSYFGQTRFVPQLVQAALVDAGRLGRKTGRGIYDYADGQGVPVPLVAPVLPHPDAPARPDAVEPGELCFETADACIMISRGRTARAEARVAGRDVAVIDWFEGATAGTAGYTASSDAAAALAASLLAAWGLEPFLLADRPGLIVLRTLAQIANAAGDAVLEGVSDEMGIDNAMQFGANYPFGPCAWAHRIGAHALVGVLTDIAAATGEPLYNPSEYWISKA